MRSQYLYMSYMLLTLYTSRAKDSDTDMHLLESLFAKTFGKILAYLRVFGLFLPKMREERNLMDQLERDQTLLSVFVNHLHSTGALSVPPEDLNESVEEISVRFSAIEQMVGTDDKDEQNAQ
jgi:hypothetical protein